MWRERRKGRRGRREWEETTDVSLVEISYLSLFSVSPLFSLLSSLVGSLMRAWMIYRAFFCTKLVFCFVCGEEQRCVVLR